MQRRACVLLAAAGGLACGIGCADGQTYEQGGARITFQVFNPATTAWTSIVDAAPGQRVEWRVVLDYIGTRTDLFALGEALYQPVIDDTDNVDGGNGVDVLASWRNGGISGNSIAGSMLTAAEGNNGGQLASYGRVRFGGTVMSDVSSNTLSTFRHSGGAGGGPAGDYLRVAGAFADQWPRSLAGPVPPLDVTTDDINRTLRGVSSQQQSQTNTPAFHVQGTSGLVVFRSAIILSADPAWPFSMELSTFRESFRRVGGATTDEADDRRFFTWQTGGSDSGSHRTLEPQIVPAFISLIPAPGGAALFAVALACVVRRRRFAVVATECNA